jgi:hypothetical protein
MCQNEYLVPPLTARGKPLARLAIDELHVDEKIQPDENCGRYLTWLLPDTNIVDDDKCGNEENLDDTVICEQTGAKLPGAGT